MPKVAINKPAPLFSLDDFEGKSFELIKQRNIKNVLLIFNRGFM